MDNNDEFLDLANELPKLLDKLSFKRKTQIATSLAQVKTELNDRVVTVEIKNYIVRKEKSKMAVFSTEVVDWMIETGIAGQKNKSIVYRTDADFYNLRSALL